MAREDHTYEISHEPAEGGGGEGVSTEPACDWVEIVPSDDTGDGGNGFDPGDGTGPGDGSKGIGETIRDNPAIALATAGAIGVTVYGAVNDGE